MTSEGINFNPTAQKPVSRVDKSQFVDRDLDDIIKEDRKNRRLARAALNKSRPRSANKNIRKKSTRSRSVDKKAPKKEITNRDSKKLKSKAIEIKVPQSALQEILGHVGIDTEGYSLRLIAKKKQ